MPANTLGPTHALTEEHSERRKQADGDGNGGHRGSQDVAFSAQQASGRGREDQALRGEHAGVASSDVLHRGREHLR